jgi:flagellar assembly protein FliH
MVTILRAADASRDFRAVAFQFDDLASQAGRILADARAQAERIVAEAQEQSDAIRREAAQAGCQAAMQEVEKVIAEKTATAVEALGHAAADLQETRQEWLLRWEAGAVRLATAIAQRIVRRELTRQPTITLDLVREALELAAGSPGVQLRLHPDDFRTLGTQVRALIDAMSGFSDTEVVADATISQGGCRVETRFGSIDQQIESQLRRIEEELVR